MRFARRGVSRRVYGRRRGPEEDLARLPDRDQETADGFAGRGHTVKQMDEGPALVIKRKVNGPNGMIRNAPRLLDANKQDINLAVGNGSKVRVQCSEFDWEYAGKTGKSLDLQGVQVVELVEYKAEDGSEFFDSNEEF